MVEGRFGLHFDHIQTHTFRFAIDPEQADYIFEHFELIIIIITHSEDSDLQAKPTE